MKSAFLGLVFFCAIAASAQQSLNGQLPDNLYRYGLDLLAHQQYGAARDVFTQFATRHPSDVRSPDAEYFAAYCAVNLYHGDGEQQIEQFIQRHPTNPRAATAYLELASLFYQQKNYQKANTYFSKVEFRTLSREQQNTAHFRWGYSLFSQKKLADALDQFNFVKAQGGNFGPAASYYAGFIEFGNQDYTNALIDLKRAEQNASYAAVVPPLIAQTLYKLGRFDELLTYYSVASKREGVHQADELALLASEVYFKKGDYQNALTGYQQYIEDAKSPDRNVAYRAGFAAMKVNQDRVAIDFFESAALGKDSVAAYSSYFLGALYLKANQKQQALAGFEIARQFKADRSLAEESSFQYAKIAYDLGRSDQAISELESFLLNYASSERVTEVREILSQAYINANNYNKAIEYLESLPRRGPALDRAYQKATYLKGSELFNRELYAEAIAEFEKSIQVPVDARLANEARFWCGEAYSMGKRYEQAIEHYAPIVSPAAETTPELALRARYGLGYGYYNQKQYDRALFNFKEYVNRAGKTDANLPDALLRLADCYYVTKAYPDALATYRRVLATQSPDKDYAHLQAGIVLGIQRKYTEAAAELEQVVKNYVQSGYREEAMFQLAQLDFEQGRYAPAVAGYTRVIASNPSSRFVPYALMRRAAANYNLKDYNKTASDYMALLKEYPTHPIAKDALLPLQEALGLAGRSGEFEAQLSQFKTANPDAKGIESIEYETASNLFFAQDYNKAAQTFAAYIAAYPESPKLTDARYYQAESFYRLKDFDRALEGYHAIENERTFALLPRVFARIGELEFRKARYEQAIRGYNHLAVLAVNKKDQHTAWNGLMESYYLLAQYDSADRYARIILERGNINAGAVNKAALFLGKTAMARGDYQTAQDEFLQTLNTARDEYGAEAKYLLAEIQYLQKEHKASIETLFSLINDFASYQEWVGRGFLLLADNYLGLNEKFQAQATLRSIIDNEFPLAHIRDRAAEKLRKMEQSMNTNEVSKDSIDNR